MKFRVHTYGCQMNVRDSESARALLLRHGLSEAENEAAADVVLVNTCSVRGKAEDKAIGKLGLLVATKRERPDRIVGVLGCMVQRMGEDVLKRVPGLDLAIGTHRLHRLPAVLDMIAAGKGPALEVGEDGAAPEELTGHVETSVSAFVSILLGCDRRCTYCIVPDVRGHEWSRPGTSVVREVEGLARDEVKEVTLLGQSVMSYGRKTPVWDDNYTSPLGYKEPLPRLLEAVGAVPGISRVRFTSGHPSGCTPELAAAMEHVPEVCEHLHLPSQSGSDRILKLMRRGYTVEQYRAAVSLLRERMPDFAITTDVIVGFPGETEDDFEATRAFMDEIGFDNAFIFKYSPRPGTPAAEMHDDVPEQEKLRRNKVLLADQDRRGARINAELVGRDLEVLVEGVSPRNPKRWSGRTRTNKIAVFEPCGELAPGSLVTVRIERAQPQTLFGKLVN